MALLDFCIEDEDDLFLVYEFPGRNSLTEHLHPTHPQEIVLEWNVRMHCALEVAQRLEYLHNHGDSLLVHYGTTLGNILFDNDMNANWTL